MVSAPSELDQNLGAFARIFRRSSPGDLAQAFVEAELVQVQLNLSALGLPTIPVGDELADFDLSGVAHAFTARSSKIWGVSVTCNIAHPDTAMRASWTRAAAQYITALRPLGPVAATICTGSRDPRSMWAKHPDNNSRAAWMDMRTSLDSLLAAAEESDVMLAVEPEPGNVIAGTDEAVRLLSELGEDGKRIGFILDPANLVAEDEPAKHASVLADAFDRLGERTICLHAKDTVPWSEVLKGNGVVNYDLVLALRESLPARVPLIIQDADETELCEVRDHLRDAAIRRLSK